jgi:hypothetical protein
MKIGTRWCLEEKKNIISITMEAIYNSFDCHVHFVETLDGGFKDIFLL